VSRSIARLEARLGLRLFARTTRSIRLTHEGELYRGQCQQALDQIAEAERSLAGGNLAAPRGLLRISAPTTWAHHRLMALLPRFSKACPQVELEVHIANRNVDFVEEGFDLAIRLGEPRDSRLIARHLEDTSLGVFASPDYLKRRGTPRTLAELREHDCIQFIRPSTGRPMPWLFREDGREVELTPRSRQCVTDDVLGCVDWARAGGGLYQTYHFIAKEALERRELVEVLKPFGGRSRPFFILYPQNRQLSARVRAFSDFLIAQVQGPARRAPRGRPPL
jgi:DNA-binding transcriptional LysR family regulator